MDIESLRTLAKRLQVRLGVLEDILEQTGIMSDDKREELYAKHSAEYDQDEARTLAAAREEAMADYQPDIWGDDYDPASYGDGEPESRPANSGEEELNMQLEIWSRCGCNSCHSNIIEQFGVIDAVEYWQDVVENCEEVDGVRGMINHSIIAELMPVFITRIGENSCLYTSRLVNKETSPEVIIYEDPEKIAELQDRLEEKSQRPDGFGDGVFSGDDMCEAVDNQMPPEDTEDPLLELLAIIDQPIMLFGSTEEWVNAIREAASRVQL